MKRAQEHTSPESSATIIDRRSTLQLLPILHHLLLRVQVEVLSPPTIHILQPKPHILQWPARVIRQTADILHLTVKTLLLMELGNYADLVRGVSMRQQVEATDAVCPDLLRSTSALLILSKRKQKPQTARPIYAGSMFPVLIRSTCLTDHLDLLTTMKDPTMRLCSHEIWTLNLVRLKL